MTRLISFGPCEGAFPHPDSGHDAYERLVPPQEVFQTLSREDQDAWYNLRTVANTYHHIVAHPGATWRIVREVRKMRSIVKQMRKAGDDQR